MLKKCTISVLFTVLAMAGVANAAYSGTPTPKTNFGKDGDCYKISTAEDLYGFAAIVNGGESDACGVLTADITVNENVLTSAGGLNPPPEGGFTSWTPIGTDGSPFAGTFDGQGHTISGLYFNNSDDFFVGLFGYVDFVEEMVSETVSISNVGIEDSYFRAANAVGGVVGWVNYVALNMENVYNAAVVVGSFFVGGVVGSVSLDAQTLNMVNVYNVGSVNCDDDEQAGGLVGYFMNDLEVSKITIKNSYNYGNVGGGAPLVGMVADSEFEDAVIVTNSFYLGSSSSGAYGEFKSAIDFSNGTVFAALHSAEDGEVWRQYKNDAYPTFAAKTGTDAPAPMHTVVLHYSETDSVVIAYTQGTALTLPTELPDGSIVVGDWYKANTLSGTSYTQVASTENGDLNFYAKVMKLDDDGYYEIADADMLFKFAELVNNQNAAYASAKVKLTEDIVVNQNVLKNASGESCVNDDGSYNTTTCPDLREWTPIGNLNNKFQGSFDGQGHTISGLYINEPILKDYEYNALFGAVDGKSVTIKNVGVEDSYFSGQRFVSGLVGVSYAEALKIENCYNAATLYGINGLGGLVGELAYAAKGLLIENSYNFGTIKYDTKSGGSPAQSGALVGQDQNVTEVKNSYYLVQEGVESEYGTAASSDAFANGAVAKLLHGKGTDADSLWGQNVKGGDSHPNFFKGVNVENGPGVIDGGQTMPTITLRYPDDTDSTFTYLGVWGTKLPEKDKNGNYVIWYDDDETSYIDISSALEKNLGLHAVVFEPVDGFYEITDVATLYKFAAIVNDGNATAKAILMNDIVVNENVLGENNANVNADGSYNKAQTASSFRVWTPIGYYNEDDYSSAKFSGSFDGQGYTISGLYYNNEKAYNVGLFGYAGGQTETIIKNVGVKDSYFNVNGYAGGILGEFDGGEVSVENVFSEAVVVGIFYLGGVIGTAGSSGNLSVTNAYNAGKVIGNNGIGGFIGNVDNVSTTITNSYNYGDVVGGSPIVGNDDYKTVAVTNSYYLGDAKNGSYGTNKSAADFANGTVLAALNPAEGDAVWEQGNDYPVLLVFSNSDDEFKPNAEGYYEIATADDLYKFAEIVNGGNATAKAMLVADICVNACGDGESVLGENNANVNATTGEYTGADSASFRKWTPIGNEDKPFKGSFDGQGHTISGLYFKDINAVGAGLFGTVDGTVSIDNVGLVDSYIKAGLYAGGLVGYAQGSLTINNSYNASSVNAPGQTFGGLVGAASDGGSSLAISNSYNVGPLNGKGYGGGLVGFANKLVVTNSYNAGSIYNRDEFAALVGGITSSVTGATTITNCFNYGVISYPSNISVTVDDLVAKVDNKAEVTVTNSFTIGESVFDGATKVTSDEFSDGTVLAALNPAEGDAVWEQGKDYPVLLVFSNSDDEFKPNADGYYEIATVDDLYKFAEIVNNGTVPDAKAKLMNDIVVNENVLATAGGVSNVNATTGEYTGSTSGLREWTPINSFNGTFDGQGYSISGLYYDDENVNGVGLFGYTLKNGKNASIKNVGVEDSYFRGRSSVGGILGRVEEEASANIENVYSAAVVVATQNFAGGIIGYDYGAESHITNAYNVGLVLGGNFVGGIVGGNYSDNKSSIENSYNYGSVSGEVGALVGNVRGKLEVSNSFYLASEKVGDYGSYMSADEFADGTVLIALRGVEGGNVWVQNPNDKYPSIDINATNANTIVLDWSTAADDTTLVGAGYTVGAVVIVKAGKTFYADGKIYEGVLSAEQVAAIGDNKLYPVSGLKLENVSGKLVATLDGDSKESVMIPTDVAVDKVIYKRDVENGKALATIMLPFSAPLTSLNSDFKICQFTRMEINDKNRYEVHVSGIKENFDANTPYIIRPLKDVKEIVIAVEGSAENPLILNSFTGTKEKSVTTKDGVEWTMKGVYDYKVWEAGNPELGSVYGFAAENMSGAKIGEFRKLGANASIQPMRMYLLKSAAPKPLTRPGLIASFAQVEEMSVNVDVVDDDEDQSMLINRITVVPTVVKSNRWFDMKGRALGGKPTAKGTYYYNGKRIIIK